MNDAMPRPRLRGRLHQIAFIFSIPAGVAVVALGRTGRARAAASVYAVGIMALYGVSAAYHRIPWSPRARQLMRRLDHSTIFLFIAATYTPFSVLALQGAWRVSILAAVWGIAAIGVALKMTRLKAASRAGTAMYVALGWTAIVALPQLVKDLSAASIALLFIGGALYTTGAIIYALRRPDPDPQVFGYHELYHSFVIVGSLCHYAMIVSLAVSAH
ncbi:MAG: PAQR family membrane homeostasis protein TrhA [Actinomycetota bacterium]